MTPRERCEQQAREVLGKHLECEDAWYSCPKSEEGCLNEVQGDDCNCGLDRRIQDVTDLLLSTERAVLEKVADTLQVGRFEYDEKSGMNIITNWPSPDAADWCRKQAEERT